MLGLAPVQSLKLSLQQRLKVMQMRLQLRLKGWVNTHCEMMLVFASMFG